MKLDIEQGEHEIISEGASHLFNFIAVGGIVTLTNKRIVFTSAKSNYSHEIEIRLSEISRLDYFKTMFINPNGLALLLKNGNIEHFVFDDRVSWYKRIEKLMHLHA